MANIIRIAGIDRLRQRPSQKAIIFLTRVTMIPKRGKLLVKMAKFLHCRLAVFADRKNISLNQYRSVFVRIKQQINQLRASRYTAAFRDRAATLQEYRLWLFFSKQSTIVSSKIALTADGSGTFLISGPGSIGLEQEPLAL